MSDTLLQDQKQFALISRIMNLERAVEALRANQVKDAVTEVYHQTNDQFRSSNLQYWNGLNAKIQVSFQDWVFQNFYWEITAKNFTSSSTFRVCHFRLYDYIGNAEFVGSHISTSITDAEIIRSSLLTKPAQTGTYKYQEQFGIAWVGSDAADNGGDLNLPDSFAYLYMAQLVIRYEGG